MSRGTPEWTDTRIFTARGLKLARYFLLDSRTRGRSIPPADAPHSHSPGKQKRDMLKGTGVIRDISSFISRSRPFTRTLGSYATRAMAARLPRMFPIAYKLALA